MTILYVIHYDFCLPFAKYQLLFMAFLGLGEV